MNARKLTPNTALITWNNGSWKVFNLETYSDHALFDRYVDATDYLDDLFGYK